MFTTVVVLIAALASVSGRNIDLNTYTFEKFVQDFDFEWKPNTAEWEQRKSLFVKELERVRSHNAAGKSWKEGINKFSAMTSSELKAYKGRSKGVAQHHKPTHRVSLPSNFAMKPVAELPARVDWRDAGIVSPVKDQGNCGSCWAFASTATLESHVAKETGVLFDLSVHQTAMCAPNPDACGGTGGCQGSTAELAFDYMAKNGGLFQEFEYGYNAYRGANSACAVPSGKPKALITGYVQLPENNYTALMNAVATVGPVSISVDASWPGYSSGIYNAPLKNPDIDHAVVLVGYGEDNGQKYWLVRNSWSPTWGEKGYIRIARSDNDEANCAMDTTPQDGTACAGQTDAVKVCGTSGILYDSAYPVGASRA